MSDHEVFDDEELVEGMVTDREYAELYQDLQHLQKEFDLICARLHIAIELLTEDDFELYLAECDVYDTDHPDEEGEDE